MNSILIVTYTKNTLRALMDQLIEIGLQEYFVLNARTVDELDYSDIKRNSLVLISSRIVYTMVKPYLPESMPYIITRRTINYGRIRELLEIPKGTMVYLVSDLKQSAEDTIGILKEAGIELDFMPYYSQETPRAQISIAVTAGEPQLVPKQISRVINLGSRQIDISTLVEIFDHFQISPNTSTTHLSARFMQSLVDLTKDLSGEILRTKILQQSLENIVQNMDDAVLVYNNENVIEHFNRKAAKLLNLFEGSKEKNNIHDLPSAYFEAMMSVGVGQGTFAEIEDIAYYMRKKRIIIDEQVYSTLIIFRKVEDYQKIEHDYRSKAKQKNLIARHTFDDIKTRSASVIEMIKIANRLAKSDSTILILGETGTGKEVLAQAIHNASLRMYQPFIGVNFAAISESLMESELFGYEPGAFTGARKSGHMGMFEQAHKGSIFLDEIGDASPVIQNRLLRVLQERQIMRVGGDRMIPLDVRVIAATNKDLNKLIDEEKFREDLYYRLNVLPLKLLPLRERKQDISLLINIFIKEFQEKLGRDSFSFSKGALRLCEDYHWPGNVRELRNVVEYAAHISDDIVYKQDLPFWNSTLDNVLQENHHEDLESIRNEFLQKGFLDEVLLMLDLLSDDDFPSAGRAAMAEHLLKNGVALTDQQLRYRQKLLNNFELIRIEKGRAGSRITQKGKRFLDLELCKR
ncbi:sigma-54-dependent Fis family transcriptional regulator [Cytobacillus firmus]|uniref:sigma-54 interaction domain-containing protein n=1 Tax=Cytobacillus firmus TaxID=1399 RepID=UPI001C8D22BD|nr:sigma 54-interacting transcriptional regulator [Cytobacillus firmus]MBX9974509.1 sigma 54-interacting transcriptional regulator [Cytobacillus firmus]